MFPYYYELTHDFSLLYPCPGLRLSQEMKHYGFGVSFPTVSLRDLAGDLVVQYEVKFDETLNCGGAYIKLLRDGDMGTLDGSTAYSIMFGPDRCGATNKIHFILQHRNPISGLWEEKHFNESLPVKADTFTHLYSLRVGRDNTFAIALDNKVAAEGNLLTHMVPPVNPDKEVYDPQDLKPRDWVDDEFVVDKNAVKPDDWDEKQPRRVPDAHVVQPADWLGKLLGVHVHIHVCMCLIVLLLWSHSGRAARGPRPQGRQARGLVGRGGRRVGTPPCAQPSLRDGCRLWQVDPPPCG
ncbi:hypothetical protein EON64_04805 [archaeon]|nr:MAG: hypothetical protein EON64_04805 [archaeon]